MLSRFLLLACLLGFGVSLMGASTGCTHKSVYYEHDHDHPHHW